MLTRARQFRSVVSPKTLDRRKAILGAAAAGTGFWLAAGTSSQVRAQSANDKLDIALIGIGGQGKWNLDRLDRTGENIVALCDVDDNRAGDAYQRHSTARKFLDYRKMYDEMGSQIDAVLIATPDHTHFHPAYYALQLGKHVYLEKPMAHSVKECRILTDLAKQQRVATQLGMQRHANPNMRRVVELIRSKAIGEVTEVYSWVTGARGMPKYPPMTSDPPAHVKWDLWLGPAKPRPFSTAYVPYGWRFWWDFGTGEGGNWGCHILDIPFWALDLTYPTRVDGAAAEVHPQTTPTQMTSRFMFPATANRPGLTLHWDHAENGPGILHDLGLNGKRMNNLFIGTTGMLLCGFNSYQLLPAEKYADYRPPDASIPDSPGFHDEWIAACKGGAPATCDWDYSGPLAETVLLANVACRAAGGFEWDAATLSVSGNPRAEPFLMSHFEPGWKI